jgi:hypothetical protein
MLVKHRGVFFTILRLYEDLTQGFDVFEDTPVIVVAEGFDDLIELGVAVIVGLEGELFIFDHAFEADFLIGGGGAIDQQFHNDQFGKGHAAGDFLGHDVLVGIVQDIEVTTGEHCLDRIVELR